MHHYKAVFVAYLRHSERYTYLAVKLIKTHNRFDILHSFSTNVRINKRKLSVRHHTTFDTALSKSEINFF